jgi:hypothetical protein
MDTSPSPDGKYMILRVVDTGNGLSPEQLCQFNSPLSSDTMDKEMGLGLRMVSKRGATERGRERERNGIGGG